MVITIEGFPRGALPQVAISLRNYRAFFGDNPGRLDLQPGLTALVGPNNGGKSSLLKFAHEFRDLFGTLATTDRNNWVNAASGSSTPINMRSVGDKAGVFSDRNDRNIELTPTFTGDWPRREGKERLCLREAQITIARKD